MDLTTLQQGQGAVLAPDHIPLHFGDQAAEYRAALDDVILLDRSHEARLALHGQSAVDLLHRISTNDLTNLAVNEGRPTIFTSPQGRILDRVAVFQRADHVLLLGEPGRGAALASYLQRNIFFGDDVQLSDKAPDTRAFDLHGPAVNRIIEALKPDAEPIPAMQGFELETETFSAYVTHRKPVIGQRWSLVVPAEQGAECWSRLTDAGAKPAGSLVYNVLRVRGGLPSNGRELGQNFIPLEVGLWDEVSFSKGCYTGQEIIARLESRNRLAKTLVMLALNEALEAPADIYIEGRRVGQLTSSATAPDGEIFALGVVKPEFAQVGQKLQIGITHIEGRIKALAGTQPDPASLS